MSRRLAIATFHDADRFVAAARACRTAPFDVVEAYSPFPVHGIDEALAIRPTRLPWLTLFAAVTGVTLATYFQFWASADDWPIDVGGKPWNSFPAFVPVTFEVGVLFAGIATFVGVLLRSGLQPFRIPQSVADGTTDDRHVLVVARLENSPTWPELVSLLSERGADDVKEIAS